MKTNTAIIISAVVIALALVFCGISISRAIIESETMDSAASSSDTLLMNEEATAKYLGVKAETLRVMLKEDSKEKANISVYPTYKFIPYVMIEGNKYFSKGELEKWVEYNMHNK